MANNFAEACSFIVVKTTISALNSDLNFVDKSESIIASTSVATQTANDSKALFEVIQIQDYSMLQLIFRI